MATGVVEANRRLSDIQGAFQDRGAQFFKGYEKSLEAKREREAKNKETQARVNGLMDQFKNEVDVLKFKPEDQTLVKNTIVGWRQEYADAANAAAQIQDKSSAEYQEYMDIMNGIQNKMTNLKNNIDNLAAFKKEYADNIKAGHYSNAGANDMSLAQGEIMFQYPIGSISDNGDLMWDDEGTGAFGFQDYEMPFEKATGLASALGKIADPIRMQRTPLDDLQKREIKEKVDALVRDPKALASLISDSDLPGFDFSNIDPEDPNAKEQVADLLVRSIEGLRGKGIAPNKNSRRGGGGSGGDSSMSDSKIATKLDKMLEIGIPSTIGGIKYTPIKEPYKEFKDLLADKRAESKGKEPELTAENLGLSNEDFELFMDWYNGDISDQPIFRTTIGGEDQDFTYDELMRFYSL